MTRFGSSITDDGFSTSRCGALALFSKLMPALLRPRFLFICRPAATQEPLLIQPAVPQSSTLTLTSAENHFQYLGCSNQKPAQVTACAWWLATATCMLQPRPHTRTHTPSFLICCREQTETLSALMTPSTTAQYLQQRPASVHSAEPALFPRLIYRSCRAPFHPRHYNFIAPTQPHAHRL